MSDRSWVADTLGGTHIVVTSFTGFLAKVYVALLLEYVPDIGRITLLVRPRSARKRALQRVEEAFDTSPVFRRLRERHGRDLGRWLGARVEALDADIEKPLCGLDAAALEQYELLLEEQMFPFEEKAIDLYKANADRAPVGVYDEWVQKSFDRLAGLMPARYAKKERSEDVVTSLY